MHHSTHISDDDAKMLAGIPASSSLRPRRGDPVILSFQARHAAAAMALEDAMEPDEGFEPLGSIAVRLLAEWKLPRLKLAPSGRTDDASA